MRVRGDWIEAPATQAVFAALAAGGHRALAVGGCVRDALLGAPVSDVDLATDATPERVTELAEAAGLRAVPTGIEHGTVTVVSDGAPHEVTTFRRDVETDGRHAVVAFSDRVEDDAARRDFTVNALYAEACGALVDPLGGLPDLRARRVRFVGEAEARIREDYLRILRFFRFHARLGDSAGGLDPEGLAACARLAGGLAGLSAERVGSEMTRLLATRDPAATAAAMAEAGVLARVMPGAEPSGLPRLVAAEAGRAPGWHRRAVVMGGEGLAERWRLSRADARRLEDLRAALAGGMPPHEAAYRHGADLALDLALIRAGGAPPAEGLEDALAAAAGAVPPIRAADLMPPLEGPALGLALARAEEAWLASGFALSREALIALALGTGRAPPGRTAAAPRAD